MKPLKYEIQAVADVLGSEAGVLEKVASKAIEALDQARAQRQHYGILFAEDDGGPTYICVGPFRTMGQCVTWAKGDGFNPDEIVRVVMRAPEYKEGD